MKEGIKVFSVNSYIFFLTLRINLSEQKIDNAQIKIQKKLRS